MKIINYISTITMPIIILYILIVGIKEKLNIYDLFIKGVKEGIKIVIKLFPTLLAVFMAVGMLRASGITQIITIIFKNITNIIKLPPELIPLIVLRPISGSASLGIATDIMKTYGVDSLIGKMAATIIGSTETTLYVISIYTSSVNIKKTKFVLICALIADTVGILTAIIIWNLFNI